MSTLTDALGQAVTSGLGRGETAAPPRIGRLADAIRRTRERIRPPRSAEPKVIAITRLDAPLAER